MHSKIFRILGIQNHRVQNVKKFQITFEIIGIRTSKILGEYLLKHTFVEIRLFFLIPNTWMNESILKQNFIINPREIKISSEISRNNNSKRQEGVPRINKNLIFQRFIKRREDPLDFSIVPSVPLSFYWFLPSRGGKTNGTMRKKLKRRRRAFLARYYSASTPPMNRRRKRRRRRGGTEGKGSIQGDPTIDKEKRGEGRFVFNRGYIIRKLGGSSIKF